MEKVGLESSSLSGVAARAAEWRVAQLNPSCAELFGRDVARRLASESSVRKVASMPPQTAPPTSDRPSKLLALQDLDLDARNPRFGGIKSGDITQKSILDHIIQNFSVADVISSLSVNGYFRAEPLVGRRIPGSQRYVIVEGNRRLAACLLLSGDPRAAGHEALAEKPRAVWESHGSPVIDPVPVICFEEGDNAKELLSYLGVRHISGSTSWDSYAKAVWVSEVVNASALTVAEVAQMVGDKHKTVARLLEGYYFTQQAEQQGQFRPTDSVRSGRGSVTAYPFSWVYTVLGYQAARGFLGLAESDPKPEPIKPDNLSRAGLVLRAMFGDKSKGLNSAVSDSRELGDLAAVLGSAEKVALLEQGRSIAEITRITRPIDDRLRHGLAEVRLIQQEILTGLTEQSISTDIAQNHLAAASTNRRSSQAIEKGLNEIISPADE